MAVHIRAATKTLQTESMI